MTRNVVKVFGSIAVSALVLVSVGGTTQGASVPEDAAADAPCNPFEDWKHLRWFGLWSDEYHIISTPHFNPHEESRWWHAIEIADARGYPHWLREGPTLDMHTACPRPF